MSSGGTGHDDVKKLRRSVDWAMRQDLGPEELVPMLRRLARTAAPESTDFTFAHRHLAELSVEQQPWSAALSARQVLARTPEDDGAWAVLGLSFTLLGHYRAAVSAYRRAISLAPQNPWYGHNLGHLLDVALDRPVEAVRLLHVAHEREPREADIAASYVHALGRVGRVADARKLLKKFMRGGGSSGQKALMQWLDSCEAKAPAGQPPASDAEEQPPRRKKRSRRQAPSN
jgi:tetratricopeptide (TPR) repeat protein